jgi:hypothetical protein
VREEAFRGHVAGFSAAVDVETDVNTDRVQVEAPRWRSHA